MSIRERIVDILSASDRPLEAREIAHLLGLEGREAGRIYEDLIHIAKSLRVRGLVLLMEAPRCLKCGYVFKNLKRPKRPSRCPRCKSEWISNPRFIIRARDEVY